MNIQRSTAWFVALLVLSVVIGACGVSDDDNGASPVGENENPPVKSAATVTLTKTGCEYDGPSEMAAGELTITMVNSTQGPFDLDVWLLNEGDEYKELVDHIAEEIRREKAGKPPLGHPTFATLAAEATAKGKRGELSTDVDPGTYGLACIPVAGVLWYAAGPFTVSS